MTINKWFNLRITKINSIHKIIIGEDKLKAYLTGEEISGTSIDNVKRSFK